MDTKQDCVREWQLQILCPASQGPALTAVKKTANKRRSAPHGELYMLVETGR